MVRQGPPAGHNLITNQAHRGQAKHRTQHEADPTSFTLDGVEMTAPTNVDTIWQRTWRCLVRDMQPNDPGLGLIADAVEATLS